MREGVRLAVDVGSVRVGVARSDPGGILASPLTVVRSGPGELDELATLVARADCAAWTALPAAFPAAAFAALAAVAALDAFVAMNPGPPKD